MAPRSPSAVGRARAVRLARAVFGGAARVRARRDGLPFCGLLQGVSAVGDMRFKWVDTVRAIAVGQAMQGDGVLARVVHQLLPDPA